MMQHYKIFLLSSSEPFYLKTLKESDEFHASSFFHFNDLDDLLNELKVSSSDLILFDLKDYENSALESLIQIRAYHRKQALIITNLAGNEKLALSCIKNGADDYIIQENGWLESIAHKLENTILDYEKSQKKELYYLKLEQELKIYKEKEIFDKTTHFYKADHFEQLLAQELYRASRYGLELACITFDIKTTYTKSSNELFQKLSLFLKSLVRSCDIWGRLNDHRFSVLLPNTNSSEAAQLIKRINDELEDSKLKNELPINWKYGIADYNKTKNLSEKEFLKESQLQLNS